ncbi:MAG: hypothetical protein ACOCYZ_02880 [Halococcoides sp.]
MLDPDRWEAITLELETPTNPGPSTTSFTPEDANGLFDESSEDRDAVVEDQDSDFSDVPWQY